VKEVIAVKNGEALRPWLSPGADRAVRWADRAVRWAAVVLTSAGALLLLVGVNAGIALPLVAVGASLVAVEQVDRRRSSRSQP